MVKQAIIEEPKKDYTKVFIVGIIVLVFIVGLVILLISLNSVPQEETGIYNVPSNYTPGTNLTSEDSSSGGVTIAGMTLGIWPLMIIGWVIWFIFLRRRHSIF